MSNRPRNHHYVPAFYLSNFSDGDPKVRRLFVSDRRLRKQWPTTAAGAGYSRDFYAVCIPGEANESVEVKLGHVESKCAEAMARIIGEKAIANDNDFTELVTFVALMAVRGPRFRKVVSKFMSDASRKEMQAAVASRDSYEQFKATVRVAKTDMSEQEEAVLNDYEGMRDFAFGDTYTVETDQTSLVRFFLNGFISLMPYLGTRQWVIWHGNEDAPDFVCSDSPVCLTWKKPGMAQWPPGFGLRNTVVTMPLNRRFVLVGTYEDLDADRVLDREDVGLMNARTILYAEQAYSGNADFLWRRNDASLGTASDFIENGK